LLPKASTHELNIHPVAMLYASKISSITELDHSEESNNQLNEDKFRHHFGFAYNWAKEQVKP
jgi:hypothetical protein